MWMVIRVKPRFEKKAEALLNSLTLAEPDDASSPGILATECHPLTATALLVTTERKWSDRMKKVELPAINGYIFASFTPGLTRQQKLKALVRLHYTAGILRILTRPGCSAFDPDQVDTVTDRDLRIFYAAAQLSGNSIQPAEDDANAITKGKTVRFREGLLAQLGVQFKVDDMRKNQPTLYFDKGIFKNARFIVSKSQLEVVKYKIDPLALQET